MITVSAPDFAKLSAELKTADKKIQAEMRKSIRKSGESAVRDVREAIGNIPSSGGSGTGVRAALAAGTTVSISARGRSAGASIRTSPSRLPPGKRPLAKAFNLPWFRHPVFGSAGWVNQPGNPYFGAVIGKHYREMRAGIAAAMVTAEKAIAADLNRAGG